MKAAEAVGEPTFAPLADGVPVAIQLLGQLLVGGVVLGRSVEDDPTAERQGLGRRACADQGLQVVVLIRGKDDT